MSAPCLKCGAPTESRVEFTGLLEGDIFMCDACSTPAMAELAEHRRQFYAITEAGARALATSPHLAEATRKLDAGRKATPWQGLT